MYVCVRAHMHVRHEQVFYREQRKRATPFIATDTKTVSSERCVITSNLDLLLARFDRVRLWTVTQIVCTVELQARVNLVRKLLKVAHQLRVKSGMRVSRFTDRKSIKI
jgi:hypothetical protein